MNTLLGELATLNDIQYARYRLAVKLRKLQKGLLLDQVDISTLQEGLHLSNVESLSRIDIIPTSQLLSCVHELYSCLRLQRPILSSSQLKQAQELCGNWLQMNYHCSTGGRIQAGSLKVTLCLLTGAKTADKARYMFSVLANSKGAVESADTTYFCTITQQLAGTLQEDMFANWQGAEQLWRECLVSVRSVDDVIDDECDGGEIRRQWLSQFEFVKLFTSLPEPSFLNWWALFQRMPSMEKVVHLVRCSVCSRKPLIAFRYQCTECINFNLCQLCFLKGRTTGKHLDSHPVLEVRLPSKSQKSWRHRLLGRHIQEGRIWDEPKSPFVFNPRTSALSLGNLGNGTDAPMNAITDMLACSQQQCKTPDSHQIDHTHKPTMIRVGSNSQPANPKQTPSHEKLKSGSLSTNSCSSIDSAYSSPGKSNYEVRELHTTSSGHCNDSRPISKSCEFLLERSTSNQPTFRIKQQENLAEINKRLSIEVDMLLSDLSSTPVQNSDCTNTMPTTHAPPQRANSLKQLKLDEMALTNQISSLSNKRNRLTGELEGLISQVQSLHTRSVSLSHGITLTPSDAGGRPSSPLAQHSHSSSPLAQHSHSSYDSLQVGHNSQNLSPTCNHSPLLNRMTSSPMTYNGLGGSQKITSDIFPDPMSDYEQPTASEWYPDTNRFSVDW